MVALDKNGQMSCNFEEFCAFWTSQPGLGGYDGMSLQFMKTKLMMKSRMTGLKDKGGKAALSLARTRSGPAPKAGEFVLKAGADFSPSLVGCEPKMQVKASLEKGPEEGHEEGGCNVTVVLSASSTDAAKSAIEVLTPVVASSPMPVGLSQAEHNVVMKFTLPEDDMDREMLEMGKNLAAAATSCKGSIGWSCDLDDVTKTPSGQLRTLLGAFRMDAEAVIDIGEILMIMNPEGGEGDPDPMFQSIKKSLSMAAGSEVTVNLGYFEGQVRPLLQALKKAMLQDRYFPDNLRSLVQEFPDISLQQVREAIISDMMGMDGNNDNPPSQEDLSLLECVRTLPGLLTGVESLTVSGLPGFAVKLSFENFNPFPLAAYMMDPISSMAKMVPKKLLNAGLAKKMSPEEEAKLTEVFKKFDKDGSGMIDLTELKAMVEELGGKMNDDEAKQAMEQLDKNKDGQCSFEEFKSFWSSKPGLGGYSSMALKFLKLKLQVEGLVGKGKRMFTTMRKPVNEADNTAVKVSCAVTPDMKPYEGHKMSVSVGIKDSEGSTFSPPKATLKLLANSAEAAGKVVARATTLKDTLAAHASDMLPPGAPLPTFSQDGEKVCINFQPPDEMVEQLQMQLVEDDGMEQVRRAMLELSKARQEFTVTTGLAISFDDMIAQPDTPISDLFQGSQAEVSVSLSPQGKQAFLSAMPDEGAPTTLAKAIIRAFAGAEVKLCQGFRQAALKELISHVLTQMVGLPEELLTPAGMRDFAKSMAEQQSEMVSSLPPIGGPDGLPPKEALEYGKLLLDSLKGIESLSFEIYLAPSSSEKGTRLEVTLAASELNAFTAANFVLGPAVNTFMDAVAASDMSGDGATNADMTNEDMTNEGIGL
eukprot:TRINITY_DN12755_c0_g1_i1.p1 TRINITY_DN12755_c0_g1~~TRINITY_DN12755_c0_g1_i1.p1  ORF type:complete len:984 (+),score=242.65 TRINITY_DN12755_c0_g1_i1:341-2953(+)